MDGLPLKIQNQDARVYAKRVQEDGRLYTKESIIHWAVSLLSIFNETLTFLFLVKCRLQIKHLILKYFEPAGDPSDYDYDDNYQKRRLFRRGVRRALFNLDVKNNETIYMPNINYFDIGIMSELNLGIVNIKDDGPNRYINVHFDDRVFEKFQNVHPLAVRHFLRDSDAALTLDVEAQASEFDLVDIDDFHSESDLYVVPEPSRHPQPPKLVL